MVRLHFGPPMGLRPIGLRCPSYKRNIGSSTLPKPTLVLSSSGLGRYSLKVQTGVRISVEPPRAYTTDKALAGKALVERCPIPDG